MPLQYTSGSSNSSGQVKFVYLPNGFEIAETHLTLIYKFLVKLQTYQFDSDGSGGKNGRQFSTQGSPVVPKSSDVSSSSSNNEVIDSQVLRSPLPDALFRDANDFLKTNRFCTFVHFVFCVHVAWSVFLNIIVCLCLLVPPSISPPQSILEKRMKRSDSRWREKCSDLEIFSIQCGVEYETGRSRSVKRNVTSSRGNSRKGSGEHGCHRSFDHQIQSHTDKNEDTSIDKLHGGRLSSLSRPSPSTTMSTSTFNGFLNLCLVFGLQCAFVMPITFNFLVYENWNLGHKICQYLHLFIDTPNLVLMLSLLILSWEKFNQMNILNCKLNADNSQYIHQSSISSQNESIKYFNSYQLAFLFTLSWIFSLSIPLTVSSTITHIDMAMISKWFAGCEMCFIDLLSRNVIFATFSFQILFYCVCYPLALWLNSKSVNLNSRMMRECHDRMMLETMNHRVSHSSCSMIRKSNSHSIAAKTSKGSLTSEKSPEDGHSDRSLYEVAPHDVHQHKSRVINEDKFSFVNGFCVGSRSVDHYHCQTSSNPTKRHTSLGKESFNSRSSNKRNRTKESENHQLLTFHMLRCEKEMIVFLLWIVIIVFITILPINLLRSIKQFQVYYSDPSYTNVYDGKDVRTTPIALDLLELILTYVSFTPNLIIPILYLTHFTYAVKNLTSFFIRKWSNLQRAISESDMVVHEIVC